MNGSPSRPTTFGPSGDGNASFDLNLACHTRPRRDFLRRPRVDDGSGGQDQARPTAAAYCQGVSSVRFLLRPFSRRERTGWSIPERRRLGQGEAWRPAASLDFLDERAHRAILAMELKVRRLAAGNQLFGRWVPAAKHDSHGLLAGPVFGSIRTLGRTL